MQMTEYDAQIRAQQIFYAHAAAYVVVNIGLVVLNLNENPDRLWSMWPLFGWGAGLALHGVSVFATDNAAQRVLARQERRAERQHRREERRDDRRANRG